MTDRVIDRGTTAAGVRWTLSAGGDDHSYSTTLQVEDDGGRTSGGGMGGPKLWGSNRLNVYTGGNPDRGPRGVVVRCAPSIEHIMLVFEDGASTEVTACGGEVVDGMRFGVSLVSPDSRLLEVIGVAGDGTVIERFDLRRHDEAWRRSR